MNKSNIKIACPRCQNSNLYKFGKDKLENQKYQCKDCRRQFSLASPKERNLKNYPKCTICGKGTFLHHNYTNYANYRCNDKKCNHSLFEPKPCVISPASNSSIKGKLDFKGMRYPVYIILKALDFYFLSGSSTRRTAQLIYKIFNKKVSHVTIASWTKKFAPYFHQKTEELASNIDLSDSDEWHADETVVFINGNKHYLWLVIDSETRMVLSFNLSPFRNSDQCFALLNDSKKFGNPNSIVTDRYSTYNIPVKSVFNCCKHIKVESFKDDISNNLIESFNKSFKSWYKGLRGFNSFESANALIYMFVFHYNFLRPHLSLNNLSPAEVAGASYTSKAKDNWLLIA